MNPFITTALLCLVFIAILAGIEYATRRLSLSTELTRRVAHISAGLFAIALYKTLPLPLYIAVVALFIFLMAYSQWKNILTSVHQVKRKTFGEVYLPLGFLFALLITLHQPENYIPSLLVITLADSFAGLTSDFLKKARKTLRGSGVFALTTFVILILATSQLWYICLLITAIVTLVERYSPRGSDNLTVPVATALLLVLF